MTDNSSEYAPRVTQLDAVSLDLNLFNLLKAQFQHTLSFWKLGWWNKFLPELDFLLQLIIWKYSSLNSKATVGQRLLGLKFQEPAHEWKLWTVLMCTSGLQWILVRHRDILNHFQSQFLKEMICKAVSYGDTLLRVASILNFLLFLLHGSFVTLPQALLNLKSVAAKPDLARSIGYSYVMRELVWHGIADLLMFILPLVNFYKLKNTLKKIFSRNTTTDFKPCNGIRKLLPYQPVLCGICEEYCVFPHVIGCLHTFCYYCVQANMLADSTFSCPVCSYTPGSLERVTSLGA